MTETSESHRIVVGADLSETGDHAIRQAVRLAKQLSSSELHVTYVIPTSHARNLKEVDRELSEKLEQLRKHVTTVCAPPANSGSFSVDTIFHIRIGDPAEVIHQVAVDVDADLIVVGTHGRKGVEKLILGSVAEELIRTARVAVLVAHPKNFANLPKSERLEPARTDQPAHQSLRLHLEFPPRNSHISGLY